MFAREWPGMASAKTSAERRFVGSELTSWEDDARFQSSMFPAVSVRREETFDESIFWRIFQTFTTIDNRLDYRCLWFSRDRRQPPSGSMITIIFDNI